MKDELTKTDPFQDNDKSHSGLSPKVRKLLRVALWLSIATGIEFLVAFTLDAGAGRTAIFILLTLVKAFYIVAEFMHLGHELRSLIYSVIVPMVFVLLLIYILLYESAQLL